MKKFRRFFYGRNGIDELVNFTIYIYLFVSLVNLFVNFSILSYLEIILLIVILFRILSKNLNKRREENRKYLMYKEKIKKYFLFQRNKWDDRYSKMYKRCPNCKNILRLPLKKGKHSVKCPKCNHLFKVRCYRNEKVKVEIIKNKKKTKK